MKDGKDRKNQSKFKEVSVNLRSWGRTIKIIYLYRRDLLIFQMGDRRRWTVEREPSLLRNVMWEVRIVPEGGRWGPVYKGH